ncbi:hypothetical protein CsSME_00044791 [Camellia sinensis var. sinensis]
MEILLGNRLKNWMATLDGTKKINFNGFGINALFSLSHTPFCFPFLHAATHCWDPFTHVFLFGLQEMCPTLELTNNFAQQSGELVSHHCH